MKLIVDIKANKTLLVGSNIVLKLLRLPEEDEIESQLLDHLQDAKKPYNE